MPSIVLASELRTILGVSSSLYNDAYLNDIIDTSENLILPMLVTFASDIKAVELTDNIAYFTTSTIHEFTEGQSVVITGCGSPFNGTRTITDDEISDYVFTAAITNADVLAKNIIPAGKATLSGASTYVGNANVESAVLAVAVEVFQSRTAAGGQIEGVDFAVTPFRLGRSLFNRVVGLLGPYIDTESMIASQHNFRRCPRRNRNRSRGCDRKCL
jgi:hypothetical protein